MRSHTHAALVSVLAIALLAWFLSHANVAAVVQAVRAARPEFIVASLLLVFVTYWWRVLRWQYLLAPIGPVRFGIALKTTLIGFAASFLLPARAGDVLRPYLLARAEGLSAIATFATIVVERVLDLVAVLGLLAFFVWGGGGATLPPELLGPIQISAAAAAAVAVVLMGLMFVLASHPERVGRFVLGLNRVLPHALAHSMAGVARAFAEGLAVARTPKPLVMALLWSFPVWIVIALEAWFVTRAFGIDMSIGGTFLLQGLLVIGVAVPTPGAVGGFHEAYRVGVTMFFGALNDTAVGAAIVLHAVSFVPVTLVGIVLMVRDGLSVRGLQGLVGEARQADMPRETDTDEVPVLRTPGR